VSASPYESILEQIQSVPRRMAGSQGIADDSDPHHNHALVDRAELPPADDDAIEAEVVDEAPSEPYSGQHGPDEEMDTSRLY
jgi:hypothetical protein